MGYIINRKAIEINGILWRVHQEKEGLYSESLKSIVGQLDAMISNHRAVSVLRFDLHQSAYTDTNEKITTFHRRLFKWLKRNYKIKRIGFAWCREQHQVKSQHYHYGLMLDSDRVKYSKKVIDKATEVWAGISDGNTCYTPSRACHNVIRGDFESTQQAIMRLSYLAKVRGKNKQPEQTKNYGTSRIKPRVTDKSQSA